MKKILSLIVLVCALPVASQLNAQIADSTITKLCRTWILDKVEEDDETKNFEDQNVAILFTFNADHTFKAHRAQDSINGLWNYESKILSMSTPSSNNNFVPTTILQITNSILVIEYIEEKANSKCIYTPKTNVHPIQP